MLNGRADAEHITLLDHGKLEEFLCRNGFAAEYLQAVPAARKLEIIDPVGSDAYYKKIIELMHKTEKIPAVLRVCKRINEDPGLLPALLRNVLDNCIRNSV